MAEKQLLLEIVTPEKNVVKDEALMVVAPGAHGEFCILPTHTPFLTTLKVGAIRYKDKGGTERYVFVNGGFSEALPDKVTILAESAERRRDVDVERARVAMKRAEERLAELQRDTARREEINYTRARASLERAMARLRIAERG
jgi:F-type H+-transporting ATPase subunit epsilon